MTTCRAAGPGFVPAAGDTTTWIYDEATGLLTSKLYPDGNGPAYTYTIDGKPATRTWARGVVTEYTYDAWGNVQRVDYSDTTPSIVIDYDSMGRETNITDAAGTTAVLYDPCGAVANETVTGALGTKSISRFYDTFGRKTVYSSGVQSLVNSYRFSSEYVDDTLGLVYYNYRHHSPLIGRWTGRDPADMAVNALAFCNNQANDIDILGLLDKFSFDDSRIVKLDAEAPGFPAACTYSNMNLVRGRYHYTIERLTDVECKQLKLKSRMVKIVVVRGDDVTSRVEMTDCLADCPCYRAIVTYPDIKVKPSLVFRSDDGVDGSSPNSYTWVLASRANDTTLLAHENVHWAITQRVAMDATSAMKNLYGRSVSCSKNSAINFAKRQLDRKVDETYKRFFKEWCELQKRFDFETDHGDEYNKEKEWEVDPRWQ